MIFAHGEEASELRRALGLALRGHREAAGRTLSAVAAEAGCSPAHLSEVERGLKDVSTDLLVGIAYALAVPVWRLYAEVTGSLAPAAEEPAWPVDPRARLEMATRRLGREELRTVAEFGAFMAMRNTEPPRRRIGFVPEVPRR
jgi:transcriptional regulator with XRE-family HTH domain